MRPMKATITLTGTLLIAALGAGCASTGPNTERGAAVGAATGAVVGGVVGNNTTGETGKGAAIGAAAGAIAGAAIGHRADQRNRTDADRGYSVQTPPPSPTSQPPEQVPPRPSQDAVWVPGYYDYNGQSYQWVAGHWEVPPAGTTTWVQPTWQQQADGTYLYTRGHWR